MKQLKELVQIVTRHRQTKPDFIDEDLIVNEAEHTSRLYNGIRQGKYATDQAAAEDLYGSPLIGTKYTTLKSRLRGKLLNSLFFLNITRQDYSEITVAFYKANKLIFWLRTLTVLGVVHISVKIAESTLSICEKYQLTAQAIDVLIILRTLYSALGQLTEYESTNEKIKKALAILSNELTAKEYFERVSLRLTKSAAASIEIAQLCEEYYNDLISKQQPEDTFDFRINTFRIGIYAHQLKQEYRAVVGLTDSAIDYLKNEPLFSSRIRLGEFTLQKMESCLYLRDYTLGNETALKCEELLRKGTGLWFLYMETYFLLAMQTGHFEKAYEIYLEITNHERFQFQLNQMKERWKIFELYLEFARKVAKQDIDELERHRGSFDLKRFLRNVPVYSQDKRGLNVAILIVHVLLLLEENDFDAIISRMDALRTYRTRYLRVRNKQSALFFKMLQIMEASSFSYKETEKRTRKLYEQLLTMATDTAEIQEAIMILRFETLWKMILQLLEQKEKEGIIRV